MEVAISQETPLCQGIAILYPLPVESARVGVGRVCFILGTLKPTALCGDSVAFDFSRCMFGDQ